MKKINMKNYKNIATWMGLRTLQKPLLHLNQRSATSNGPKFKKIDINTLKII
jgi:hypothetical protein